ncbi:hypothetical protein AHF37_09814, partial [Paragonimus kellicotti]
ILLDSGSHLEETDNSGRTPFLVACEANQIELVKLMLSYTPSGSSPSRSETVGSLVSSDQISPQPRGPYVAPIPSMTAPINRPSLDNQTPLRAAAMTNNVDLVTLLLSAGADPDYQDAYGRTTLYLLALEGELDMADLLLHTPSPGAHARPGSAAAVGANPVLADDEGRCPLHVATWQGHLSMVKLLLQGRNLDMADLLLHTPSPGAHARPGSAAAVGANPVLADDEGRCPLHVATWQGHLSMVKLLLQAGTPVDIRDREGRTPLQLSAWQGHAAICHLLLHEGNARVDAVCSQGATSLCIAAQEGHHDVCAVLLQAGANPFQADSHGRTPYRVALKAGHLDICALLERSYGTSSAQWIDPSMTADSNTAVAFTTQGYQHDMRQKHPVPLPVHFVQHSAPRESSVPHVAGHSSSPGGVICQAYQTEDSSVQQDFRQLGKDTTNGNRQNPRLPNLGHRGMLSDSHSPVSNLTRNIFVPEIAISQQQQSCWNGASTQQEHHPILYPDLLSHQFNVGENPARLNAVKSKHAPQTNTTNVSDSQPTHGVVSPTRRKDRGNASAEKLKTGVDESTDLPAKSKTGSPNQASPLSAGPYPSPSAELHKAPSTKSTIAGMFGLGIRRGAGKKLSKKSTLSEIPPTSSESTKPSPKSQNVHPTVDKTTNFEGKQPNYSASRAQISNNVPDPTKSSPVHPHPTSSVQQQNVSNASVSKATDPSMTAHCIEKYPSGSVQLESLARKFACCSQIEGVPSETKMTYWMKKGQTASKVQQQQQQQQPSQRQTSPQLWVSQSQARKKSSRRV